MTPPYVRNGHLHTLSGYWVQARSWDSMYATLVTLAPSLTEAEAMLVPDGSIARAGCLALDLLDAWCDQHSSDVTVIPDGVLWQTSAITEVPSSGYFPTAFRGWCLAKQHHVTYPQIDYSLEQVVATLIGYRREARP